MWKVKGDKVTFDVMTLDEAMHVAKLMSGFVTITDGTMEIVGKFGVDAVENATLPDGESYTWTMRRDETHRSWRKKLG